MQTNQMTKEEWFKKATESVDYFDAVEATKLLRDWTVVHGSKVSDKQADERLDILRKNLFFTAFALLPFDQANLVLREYLIDFLKSGKELLNPIEKVESRIKVAGYGLYEQERERMKGAVMMNKETIGKSTVSEWITRFEKTIPLDNVDLVGVFLLKDSEVASLSKDSQIILKLLFTLYEQWLFVPVFSVFDIAVLYKKADQLNNGRGAMPSRNLVATNRGQSTQSSPAVTVNLPLLQALSKYENLGNQLITNERIRIKTQGEPVRPSLLYWLKCYRDELGIGQHNSVERGNFLFRSENCKKLSPEERERVSLILKSIEENLPLSIDMDHQEIVFPIFQGVLASTHADSERSNINFDDSEKKKTPFNIASVSKGDAGGISFSAGHIFPAEKEEREK